MRIRKIGEKYENTETNHYCRENSVHGRTDLVAIHMYITCMVGDGISNLPYS